MSGMVDVDMAMFQHDASSGAHYVDSYSGGSDAHQQQQHHHHPFSPPVGYNPDGSWASDVDMGTPSTGPFPASMGNGGYHHSAHGANSSNHHLQLPQRDHHGGTSLHSPRSSRGAISPGHHPGGDPHAEERPPLSRSNTAPEQRGHHRRSTTSGGAASSSITKRAGSDDGEEEYLPLDEVMKGSTATTSNSTRGRKRQRVPHTAVERRYRENLNAHLDKLRQTVPAFAKRKSASSGKGADGAASGGLGEGVKPSKCEILNGAIEHILAVDKENAALKNEVQILRARLEELERWYGNAQAGGGAYGGP